MVEPKNKKTQGQEKDELRNPHAVHNKRDIKSLNKSINQTAGRDYPRLEWESIFVGQGMAPRWTIVDQPFVWFASPRVVEALLQSADYLVNHEHALGFAEIG